MRRGASSGQGNLPTHSHSKHHWGAELSLYTESVSGVRAVSAVSAAPRFARGQCYLKSLALGARSCSFAIPKFREEPIKYLLVLTLPTPRSRLDYEARQEESCLSRSLSNRRGSSNRRPTTRFATSSTSRAWRFRSRWPCFCSPWAGQVSSDGRVIAFVVADDAGTMMRIPARRRR